MSSDSQPEAAAAISAEESLSVPLPVRTCTNCQKSKVRCDGNLPCSRCVKRSTKCYYVSKRVRKVTEPIAANPVPPPAPRSVDVASQSDCLSDDFAALLTPHQKVCMRVLFGLYTEFSSPCLRFFFERRLLRLHTHLEATKSQAELEMLRRWLAGLRVDLSSEPSRVKECPGACHPGEKTSSLKAPLSASDRLTQLRFGAFIPSLEFSELSAQLATNATFDSTFELNAKTLVNSLEWTGGTGLLPWGGDLLARLGAPVDELIAYIMLTSIKVCATPSPPAGESRVIPLVHQFVLQGRPTLVKVFLTEHFRRCASVVSDVAFYFDPVLESQLILPMQEAPVLP